jgi:hypothetical protein
VPVDFNSISFAPYNAPPLVVFLQIIQREGGESRAARSDGRDAARARKARVGLQRVLGRCCLELQPACMLLEAFGSFLGVRHTADGFCDGLVEG